MAVQGCRSSLAPPEAKNEGKGGFSLSGQGQGWKEKPTLLADSVSLGEQKAKGDMKKKGRLDPYAYIPLSKTKLNRRYGVCRVGGEGCARYTLHSIAQVSSGFLLIN